MSALDPWGIHRVLNKCYNVKGGTEGGLAPGSLPEAERVLGRWAAGHDVQITDGIKNPFKNQETAQHSMLRVACEKVPGRGQREPCAEFPCVQGTGPGAVPVCVLYPPHEPAGVMIPYYRGDNGGSEGLRSREPLSPSCFLWR